jgi:ribonuclease P/MRP protein subunit POP5
MKSLLPSLKEKKRYIVFEVSAKAPMTEQEVNKTITENFHNFVGTLGEAEAGLQFMSKRWDSKKQRGIARVSHISAEKLKASFVFIDKINNKTATVRSIGTSGILKKAVERYIAN